MIAAAWPPRTMYQDLCPASRCMDQPFRLVMARYYMLVDDVRMSQSETPRRAWHSPQRPWSSAGVTGWCACSSSGGWWVSMDDGTFKSDPLPSQRIINNSHLVHQLEGKSRNCVWCWALAKKQSKARFECRDCGVVLHAAKCMPRPLSHIGGCPALFPSVLYNSSPQSDQSTFMLTSSLCKLFCMHVCTPSPQLSSHTLHWVVVSVLSAKLSW